MNQADFNALLERYAEGTCSQQEKQIVMDWYKNMDNMVSIDPLKDTEKEVAKDRIWRNIKNTVVEEPVAAPRHRSIIMYMSIAASVLLLIWGGVSFLSAKINNAKVFGNEAVSTVIDIKNTSQKPQEVTLEDGSSVVLQPNSVFSYPEHFGTDNRTVYLTGEALFKIKRDPNKPFLVHSGSLLTEVLGTSFIIKPNVKANTTEVSVLSGKVSVYQGDKKESQYKNGVILTANHKVDFNNASKELVLGIVDNPIATSDSKSLNRNDFVFEDARLSVVLNFLKKQYGLDFIVEHENLYHCVLTADLNDLSFFTQIEYICEAIGATYERRGTNIFINGKGCPKE